MRVVRLEANEENARMVGVFLAETFGKEHRMGVRAISGYSLERAWEHIWRQFNAGAIWVAMDDDGIAGSIAVSRYSPWFSVDTHLADGWYYVRPEKRGTFAAMMLLDAASQFAAEMALPLVIEVFNTTDRPVGRFLSRFGFMQAGGTYVKEPS